MTKIREHLVAWAERLAARRAPDYVIGDHQLERWWLIPRNNWFNVYLHRFRASDEDRALHDHMYANVSWVLGPGGYWEVTPVRKPWNERMGLLPTKRVYRSAGALVARRPSTAHRIVLPKEGAPVWSLFVTGPRVRQWGFWCSHGWRHWREFTDARNSGQGGRGCE
jgi:hypothetical protein